MAILTKSVQVVSRSAKRVVPNTKKVWRALEIEFADGQVEWIVSHTASIAFLPLGSSVSPSRLLTSFDYKRNCGYLSGKAAISAPSYEILDVENTFSNTIATKLVNGIGTYNKVIREYEWEQGTPLPLDNGSPRFSSKGAWLFRDHTSTGYGTTVKVNCADINRGLDKEIFNPLSWTLDHTANGLTFPEGTTQAQIDSGSVSGEYVVSAQAAVFTTTINPDDFIANPETFWRPFEHGAHYHYQPGLTGTYMLLDGTGLNGKRKEVAWASNMRVFEGRVVVDVVRGQLQSSAQEMRLSATTTAAKGPKLKEHIYFDETVTTMYRGLITGDFNGRALPSHWAAYADLLWVDSEALAQYGTQIRLEFTAPDKSKVKDFVEKHVLAAVLAVAPINHKGALSYRPYEIATDKDSSTQVFDETNCVTSKNYTLKHKKDQIYTSIRFEYDWDAQEKTFRSAVTFTAPESVTFNGVDREKTVQLKGVTSGLHTSSLVFKLAALYGNAHFFEQQEIQIESFINDLPLGEVVVVNFTKPIVIDDANGTSTAKPLNRAFTIIAANESRNTTTYTLRGTLEKASDYTQSIAQSHLDVSAFSENGATNLEPMVNSGTLNLVMGETYYYVTNGVGLSVPGSVVVNVTGSSNKPITILVDGPIDWTPDIDLTGLGDRRIADGATALVDQNDGEVGYVGGQDSTAAYVVQAQTTIVEGGTSDQGNEEGTLTGNNKLSITGISRNRMAKGRSSVPIIEITNVDGRLEGIPASLAGSSGAGAPRTTLGGYQRGPVDSPSTTVPTTYIDGSDGGQTGGSLVFVSQGGIMRGKVITSGTEGAAPNSALYAGQTVYGAKGGSGEPSPWIWIVNGNHPRPIIDENNFHAILPDSGYVDGRYPSSVNGEDPQNVTIDGANPIHPAVSSNNLSGGTNLWATRHQILFTEPSESLQTLPVFESSASEQAEQIIDFLESQVDGEIVLYIGNTDPSNGNVDDMVITQANLDTNEPKPPFRYLTSTGWQDYDWVNDKNQSVYAALIYINRTHGANKIRVSTTRPTTFVDGEIWFNPETDLSYILSSDGNDVIYDLGQIQTGSNVYRDGRFTLQREFGNEWVFLDDVATLPTLFGGGALAGTVSGTGQLPQPTISVTPYSATQAEVIIGEPADMTGITGFEIRRGGTLIHTTSVGNNSYVDNALSATTTYTYSVRAIGGATASPFVFATITTPAAGGGGGTVILDPPTNFNATVYSTTSLELFWTSTTDTDVTGYRIRRNGVQVADKAGIASNSHFESGLLTATTYSYQINSIDGSGNESSAVTLNVTTSSVVLDPPTNFTATANGQNNINLAWTATTDTDVTGYEILRNGVSIATVSPRTSNSYADGGLTEGTAYNYTLRSIDGMNNTSGTVTASATTDSAPTLGPPFNFSGSVYGPTSGELFWSPATDTNVTGYRIFRNGSLIATKTGRTTASHYMDDMTANTTYTYTIRSIDAGGTESQAQTTTMTTNP